MSEVNMTRQEFEQYILDEDPVKYRVGDLATDGHVHYIYVRSHLPIATTNAQASENAFPHQHSIGGESFDAMICGDARGHTHTVFTRIELTED